MDGDRSSVIAIGDTVVLTPSQLAWTADVATRRERESRQAGLVDRRRAISGTGHDGDLEGAASELAFSVLMGRDWTAPVGTFHAPDSGDFDHVRSTQYETGRLIVRLDDPVDGIYVLMVGRRPSYTFRGAATGQEARKPHFLDNPNGRGSAYFVPQRCLGEYRDVLRWFRRWHAAGQPPMLMQAEIAW